MEEKGRKMQEQKIKSNIESKKADDPAVTQNLQAEEEITEQDRERARFLGEEVGLRTPVKALSIARCLLWSISDFPCPPGKSCVSSSVLPLPAVF